MSALYIRPLDFTVGPTSPTPTSARRTRGGITNPERVRESRIEQSGEISVALRDSC